MNIEKPSFKKICLMHLQALTNFPYIEKDFDAITDYELLSKVVDYLNQVISNNNEQNTVVENLYNAFVELKDYVDNYFDTLDVQDEVNNKLDEMAESGQLEEIISQYLNSRAIFGFNTVNDMKQATNLIDGSYARTLGYHSKNDGGGATYKIRNITNDDVIDEMFIIAINDSQNELIGELIIENNNINIRQLGAVENTNISSYINKYLTKNKNKIKLYIPAGTWYCGETILNKWFSIYGDSTFVGKTIIYPNIENQQYIFRIENITNWNMEYLHFETGSNKAVTNAILKLYNANYGNLNYLTFQNVIGQCIDLDSSFEINILKTIARHIIPIVLGENYGVFKITSSNNGIPSTLYFDYIQLERIEGNVFILNNDSAFYNNHIGSINIEQMNTSTSVQDTMVSSLTFNAITENLPENLKHFALFKLLDNSAIGGLSIDSIDMNNVCSCIYNYDNKNYIFDSLFYKSGNEKTNKTLGVNLNNISFIGMKQNFQLLNVRNGENNIVNHNNIININNISYYDVSNFYAYFNCGSENNINCCNINNPNNNNVVPDGVIECCKLAKGLENYYGKFGYLKFDPDSISSLKLVAYPFNYFQGNSYFKVIGMSKKLLLRYKNNTATNIVVYDVEKDKSKNFAVAPTNDKYVYTTLDLSDLTNYVIGDTLGIGVTAGFSVSFDIMKFI